MPLLEVRDLRKTFQTPEGTRHLVLDIGYFAMEPGEQVALRGASGSGKTTFLNLIAGVLQADAGRILLDGEDLATLSEAARDRQRALHIGYVFQTFNLLEGYTALENVEVGMLFGRGADAAKARALLTRVGLEQRMDYRPRQLSVGQQQRVAVARALANQPSLVLADEPTGNLDPARSARALALIREVCRENGAALLVVSHDRDVLACFERVEDLADLNRATAQEGG